jgi:A/G-specific adenine glycosylase
VAATARTGSPRRRPISPAIAASLLQWFREHRRPLPWRKDRDPYHIWVAEVLLQQTRVEQAAPYYERFIRQFPTVRSLASASVGSVLKAWQGAGYYARARHLHGAARVLVARHGGKLPATVGELEELPGVGPYIARAVASLAYGTPVVALEANGLRVAARWTREEGDVRATAVRSRLAKTIESAMPAESASEFNEAVMELGETVCRPATPRCPECPVARYCRAYRETDDPGAFPRRPSPRQRPHVRAAVVVLSEHGRWFVQRRAPSGLLGGLWEFPGGKIDGVEQPADAARRELYEETGLRARMLRPRGVVRHSYSHFTVELHVFEGVPDPRGRPAPCPGKRWVTRSELLRLPIPKATEKIVRLLDRTSSGTASPG